MRRAALLLAGTALAAAAATAPANAVSGCADVPRPKPHRNGGQHPPKAKLDASRTYTVLVVTNCGTFAIRLDVKDSPRTAASFVSLTRAHFFDGTIFHRIVPGFVIQGGDPTQSGAGGPGYLTVDKPPASTRYTLGTVAMAKTQTQPAGTSGSQFFVVTGANVPLAPDYAVLGHVVAGLPVVERIGRLGDPSTEKPTRVVEIVRMSLRVSG